MLADVPLMGLQLHGKCLKINIVPPFEKIREANKERMRI